MTDEDSVNFRIDHSSEVAGHISALFNNKNYSDVTLVVGSTQFPVHRVILASRCEYFRALFFGGLSESHESTVRLNGINSTAFYYVLGYIYTGRLKISGLQIEDALDVLRLVCQYNFTNLQTALLAHFVRSLTSSNVCLVYDAAMAYDLEDLIRACLQTIDRSPGAILALPQFLKLSRASVVRMLSRDSFCITEVEVLRGVQAWLEAETQTRMAALCNSGCLGVTTGAPLNSSSPSVVSVAGVRRHQHQQQHLSPSAAAPPGSPFGQPVTTRSNSSESLFSSASTSDSVASADAKSRNACSDCGGGATTVAALVDRFRTRVERELAEVRSDLIGCIRFELMSLSELSTEVRASRLLSPDDLLDKIGARTQAPASGVSSANDLPLRGRLLPEVNLATPRLGCQLVAGDWGNYPFFFVDNHVQGGFDGFAVSHPPNASNPSSRRRSTAACAAKSTAATNQQPPSSPRAHFHHLRQSRSVWDAESGRRGRSTYEREVALRGRGDALANASAWGFMESVAVSTALSAGMHMSMGGGPADPMDILPKNRDSESGPSGALKHLNSWLGRSRPAGGGSGFVRRTPMDPPPESEHSVVSHLIGASGGEIVIDLGYNSFVNLISMQLWDKEPRSYSYYVEVSQSYEEYGPWHRVADYSNYACRSWQTIYFPARIIRYIRVVGTRSSAGVYFHLSTFQCLYTNERFTLQTDLLVPRNNVATVEHGAVVLEGVSRVRNSLIDGDVRLYNLNFGFTCHQLSNGSIDVQLAQPFLVSSMRFLLWDLDSRSYSYIVEVSQDRQQWSIVFDASQLPCRSWQTIKFPIRPVTFIRVTGTSNTANDVFHLVHLECPASGSDSDQEEADGTLVTHPDNRLPPDTSRSSPPSTNNMVSRVASNIGGPSIVFTDAVSAFRHQRPRLLEVEVPTTPSSSLVADLSTFSLHSEATLDATGNEIVAAGGEQSLEVVSVSHHQRRRRRRNHYGGNALRIAGGGSGGGVGGATESCFSCNSRATSLSSVARNEADMLEPQPTNNNRGERRMNQTVSFIGASSDSSLGSSANNNSSEQSQ